MLGAVAILILTGGWCLAADDKADRDKPDRDKPSDAKQVPAVLRHTMDGLDGKPIDLAKYQGKVLLIVNVASRCGNTPQYTQLQELHEKYGKQGFVVLGVPANEFGKQEPGTNEEIAEFCRTKYQVGFDMLAKVVVKGEGQCELYKFLTSKETNAKFAGPIKWNFEKFLVGKSGEVVARFDPRVKPDAKEVVTAIERELAKK
jgi:glutathione peroxidase